MPAKSPTPVIPEAAAAPAPKPRPAQPRPEQFAPSVEPPQIPSRRRPLPHEFLSGGNRPLMDHPATVRLEAMKAAAAATQTRREAVTAKTPREDRPYMVIGLRPTSKGGFDLIMEQRRNGELIEDRSKLGLSRSMARELLMLHMSALTEGFNK